jgi:hypothetical protein
VIGFSTGTGTASGLLCAAIPDGSFVAKGLISGGATALTAGVAAFARDADCGSQAGHSLSLGGISRPHSGQIQWNMIQFTRNLLFIRSATYPTRLT